MRFSASPPLKSLNRPISAACDFSERNGGTVTWFWIGSHNNFDKLFG